ncbi:MAG: CHC2 zinc finger domain-containing protein [Candidatus Paceibacterota bacterium]|jgi:DNA primase
MNRSTVEEIKARLSIEDVLGSYIKLERAGKSLKAKCPFHNEKTPSFFVSPERGGYYCFGCGAKGDIFSFVEQFEGLDFRGALKLLAEKAGVPIVHDQKSDGERDHLYALIEEATKYFEFQFERSKEAREYLKCRGIKEETRKLFRIGFAPDGWRNLSIYMKGKGYNDAILEKVGLVKRKESSGIGAATVAGATNGDFAKRTKAFSRPEEGAADPAHVNMDSRFRGNDSGFYDRFRGRIMFPINDSSGRVIAFSGRILKDDGQSAKYLNSPDTPLFDKSAVLYGLDKAKSEIRRLNYSIFVEGQMDLVMSHQAGICNTVASSGTALGDEVYKSDGVVSNLGLVRRLSPNIIIAFDSDPAGRKAAMRASGIALSLGMDVKIADIVGGKDPADLAREDTNKWKEVLRNAKPVIEFEINNVLREFQDKRKLIRAIEERVLPLLARIESASDQSHFVQMIADHSKTPIDTIWQDLKVIEKRLKQENKTDDKIVTKTSDEQSKRIDLIERRLFGLLYLMKKEKSKKVDTFIEELKRLDQKSYDIRKARADSIASDLVFEAEAFFGNDEDLWEKNAKELLINFEEDLINIELIDTMQELKIAEARHNTKSVAELAKKCQALSIRKAEINKRRRI